MVEEGGKGGEVRDGGGRRRKEWWWGGGRQGKWRRMIKYKYSKCEGSKDIIREERANQIEENGVKMYKSKWGKGIKNKEQNMRSEKPQTETCTSNIAVGNKIELSTYKGIACSTYCKIQYKNIYTVYQLNDYVDLYLTSSYFILHKLLWKQLSLSILHLRNKLQT